MPIIAILLVPGATSDTLTQTPLPPLTFGTNSMPTANLNYLCRNKCSATRASFNPNAEIFHASDHYAPLKEQHFTQNYDTKTLQHFTLFCNSKEGPRPSFFNKQDNKFSSLHPSLDLA